MGSESEIVTDTDWFIRTMKVHNRRQIIREKLERGDIDLDRQRFRQGGKWIKFEPTRYKEHAETLTICADIILSADRVKNGFAGSAAKNEPHRFHLPDAIHHRRKTEILAGETLSEDGLTVHSIDPSQTVNSRGQRGMYWRVEPGLKDGSKQGRRPNLSRKRADAGFYG